MPSDERPEPKTPARPTPDAWDREAKRVVKSAMALRGYTFKSLAAAIEKAGLESTTEAALKLRVNRGAFGMSFALRVLRVMNVPLLDISHIDIGKLPRLGGRR